MKTTKMADKPPFQQDALSNSDCYILDNAGDRKIFVWKGIGPRHLFSSATLQSEVSNHCTTPPTLQERMLTPMSAKPHSLLQTNSSKIRITPQKLR